MASAPSQSRPLTDNLERGIIGISSWVRRYYGAERDANSPAAAAVSKGELFIFRLRNTPTRVILYELCTRYQVIQPVLFVSLQPLGNSQGGHEKSKSLPWNPLTLPSVVHASVRAVATRSRQSLLPRQKTFVHSPHQHFSTNKRPYIKSMILGKATDRENKMLRERLELYGLTARTVWRSILSGLGDAAAPPRGGRRYFENRVATQHPQGASRHHTRTQDGPIELKKAALYTFQAVNTWHASCSRGEVGLI